MKKTYFLFALFLILYTNLNLAQNSEETNFKLSSNEKNIDRRINLIVKNTAIDIVEKEKQLIQLKEASQKIRYNSGSLKSGELLILQYLTQNRFKEVVKMGNDLKKIPRNKTDYGIIANIYRINALAYGNIGFFDLSKKDMQTAINFSGQVDDPNTKAYLLSLCYENLTMHHMRKRYEDKRHRDSILYYTQKSLEKAKEIKDDNDKISNDLKYDHIAFCNMRLGIFYLEQVDQKGSLELAEKHLLEGLRINENKNYNIPLYNKIMMMNQLSWLYLEKNDYPKAIEFSNLALALEKKFKEAYHRVESYEFLATSYLETGDKEKSKFYMDKYSFLKDSLRIAEKNSTDNQVKEIVAAVDEKNEKSIKQKIFIIATIALALMIGLYLFWKRKNKIIHLKYEELIRRLTIEDGLLEDQETMEIDSKKISLSSDEQNIKVDVGKSTNHITDETTKNLLLKIERFERSEKYLKKEMSLTYMATSIGTNTKYLSEIIKQYKGKSFNNYMNGLRVDYIVRQLYINPKLREYKISHLAKLCGFSSREVFTVIFKRETNLSPSFFIEQLKKDEAAMAMAV